MEIVKTNICIAGPYAGQRYQSENEDHFQVMIHPGQGASAFPSRLEPTDDIIKITRYTNRVVRFPTQEIHFWGAYGLSDEELFKKLLSTYCSSNHL